jgi:hypothetical protein
MWEDITSTEFHAIMDTGEAVITAKGELFGGGTYCEYYYKPAPDLAGVAYRIEQSMGAGGIRFYFYKFGE